MDMFLVLTGFLAALNLIPALEAAASPGAVVARHAGTNREQLLSDLSFHLSSLRLMSTSNLSLLVLCVKEESMQARSTCFV